MLHARVCRCVRHNCSVYQQPSRNSNAHHTPIIQSRSTPKLPSNSQPPLCPVNIALYSIINLLAEGLDVVGEGLSLEVGELVVLLLEGAEVLGGERDARDDAEREEGAGDAAEALLGVLVAGGRLGVELPGLNGEDVALAAVVLADETGGAVDLRTLSLHDDVHATLSDDGPVQRGLDAVSTGVVNIKKMGHGSAVRVGRGPGGRPRWDRHRAIGSISRVRRSWDGTAGSMRGSLATRRVSIPVGSVASSPVGSG